MLSVIIPSYNDEKALPLAIASANAVKNVNEIIIIDDFSIDNTQFLIKNIKKKVPKLKYFKNKKNLGTGYSFIKGLEKVKNSHVLMLNSDDFLVPPEIDKLYDFTLKNKLDLGYGKMAIKKENGIFKYNHPGYKKKTYLGKRNELVDLLIFDMYIPSFGSIIRHKVLKKFYNKKYYKKVNEDYGGDFKAHDYDLFLNLAKQKKKIGFLNEYVCVWCRKNSSQSGLKYVESGEACFESAFLFNRYYLNEKINVQNFDLIESRVTKKYMDIKNSCNVNNQKTRKHYDNFISNIKKNKNFKKPSSTESLLMQ